VELIIELITLEANISAREQAHQRPSRHAYDRAKEIKEELRASAKEASDGSSTG
jgi:hypothetical protein